MDGTVIKNVIDILTRVRSKSNIQNRFNFYFFSFFLVANHEIHAAQ